MWQEYKYSSPAGSRPYFVYTPSGYQMGTPVPLIVMLHGCQQTALDFATGTQMNVLADQYNFIVLYPQQTSQANSGLCWNWFTPVNQKRGRGEPAIIAGMVQAVMQDTAQWTIDPNRLYVAGMSAGGAMTVILGATYPDIFTAIGVHSGLEYRAASNYTTAVQAMRKGGPDPQLQGRLAYQAMGSLARVLPTIVFHGSGDTVVVPVNGEQVVQQWMQADFLASNETYNADFNSPSSVTPGQVPGGYAYTVSMWDDENGKIIQEYWNVAGLGHAWSGGNIAGSFTDPLGPSASQAMYNFFMRYAMVMHEVPFWERVREAGVRLLRRLTS